jgi:hypothetical protein
MSYLCRFHFCGLDQSSIESGSIGVREWDIEKDSSLGQEIGNRFPIGFCVPAGHLQSLEDWALFLRRKEWRCVYRC